ncbi:hypothetical protein [Oscillatoria salina]|nr:hypothetical protein [Oscillatoria salina]
MEWNWKKSCHPAIAEWKKLGKLKIGRVACGDRVTTIISLTISHV